MTPDLLQRIVVGEFPSSSVVPATNPVVDPTVNTEVPAVADVVTLVVFTASPEAPEQA